jgi:hypothetical protein
MRINCPRSTTRPASPSKFLWLTKEIELRGGESDDFIGVYRTAFGIPVEKTVSDISPSEERHMNYSLAEFLQVRIVDGLKANGVEAISKELEGDPASRILKGSVSNDSEGKWVVLTLKEWYFSTDTHFNTSFNFATNVEVSIYDASADMIYSDTFKGRDVINENSDRHNDVIRAYRMKLTEILTSDGVREAISK